MTKREPPTAAQWLMARSLSEGGEPPTRSRIAAALGVHESTVYARAASEKWRPMDFRRKEVVASYRHAAELAAEFGAELDLHDDGEADPADGGEQDEDHIGEEAGAAETSPPGAQGGEEASPDLPADAGAFVSRQLKRLIARADRNGGRLDKAQIDGLVALSRMAARWEAVAMERRRQDVKRSDAELAAMLERIDERIVELAEAYAERLVATGDRDAMGRAG